MTERERNSVNMFSRQRYNSDDAREGGGVSGSDSSDDERMV